MLRRMAPMWEWMSGWRAETPAQVAGIATTRLKKASRPLGLCYAGQVLRVKGGQLRPERQVGQVGAELIGSDEIAADVEAVALPAEALAAPGVAGLSVDLSLPPLGAALRPPPRPPRPHAPAPPPPL